MKLKFIGGCKQIGGQAVSLEKIDNKVYLFDYGIIMGSRPSLPPLDFSLKNLELIFLTHAHLDHSGGLPLLFSGIKNPTLLITPPTRILTKILLKDMLNLSEYFLPFGYNELMRTINNSTMVEYNNTWQYLKGVKFLVLDAGHIPGSTSIICEFNGKRVLYTGDINHVESRLLRGMVNDFPKIDYVIMESTYGTTDHQPRLEIENEFIQSINNVVINKGGTVLIPAFGVGRSQEIMCILDHFNHDLKMPVFIDGMARTVSRALMNHSSYLKDTELYQIAIKRTHFITRGKQKQIERQNALSMPGVIIAPSGMLKGGTAIFYSENLKNDSKNAIYLVSFQLPNTLGKQILDTKLWKDGKTKIKAEVRHFPLSSHSGRSELLSFVDYISEKSNGRTTFFHIHGDEENCIEMSKTLIEKGIESIIPKNGEEFNL